MFGFCSTLITVTKKLSHIILVIALLQTPLVTVDLIDTISELNDIKKKPIIVVCTGGDFTEVLRNSLEENGVPTFTFPENAVKSIKALVDYYKK